MTGPMDEPQQPGALAAIHYGDYHRQEIWVRSGANIGNWYPLDGEIGLGDFLRLAGMRLSPDAQVR